MSTKFPRSPRPPGIEIARIGEAELKEHAEGTSRIGGSDETSIANGEAPAAVVASLSGLDTIKDGETTVSSKGPVGPPRDFARSIDSSSSMPSPRTGGICSHENALASPESQVAEASPSTPVCPGVTGLNALPGVKVWANSGLSYHRMHEAVKEDPSGDESGCSVRFRENSDRDGAENADRHIQDTSRALMINGDIGNLENQEVADFAYENNELKCGAANAEDLDVDDEWVLTPLHRPPAYSYYRIQNGW
uniref:Uncharacterized protein n=1 Tax=Ascaris lumbricoides TaxID=6252 RepID=A0A0M3HGY1_ASCLU